MTTTAADAHHRPLPVHTQHLPMHTQHLPIPLASNSYEAAIWIGLIDPGTDPSSDEAKSALVQIRKWLRAGARHAAGQPIRQNRPYLHGVWTGRRWIIPNVEIAAMLGRHATSSEVGS